MANKIDIKKTKRGWHQDRRLVDTSFGGRNHELYYIQQRYGVSGNDPETKCTTKKIREVIEELKEKGAEVITRQELMEALEEKGLLYHDPIPEENTEQQ